MNKNTARGTIRVPLTVEEIKLIKLGIYKLLHIINIPDLKPPPVHTTLKEISEKLDIILESHLENNNPRK